jgi:hypothetical protein
MEKINYICQHLANPLSAREYVEMITAVNIKEVLGASYSRNLPWVAGFI